MRLTHVGSLIAFLFLAGSAQQPPVRSPEIHSDRRVTFRLTAPKATGVELRGDFLEGAKAMQKDTNGVWSVTIGPVRPETYAYQFFVDGVRVVDPVNPAVKNASRPMETSSLLEVPDEKPMFYDARQVPHGMVQERWYSSKTLDSERRLHVYLPPNYEHSSARYPVLYLLHGAGGDDSVWINLGHANLIFDNLIADHKMEPLVVVMPYGYAFPPTSAAAATPDAQQRQRTGFRRDLIEDVIPYVQANYRVDTDRGRRAIAGLSMGGGQALTIGLHDRELFSRVAGFSAGFLQGNFKDTFADIGGNAKAVNDQLKFLWVGCGTEDRLFAANKEFDGFLSSKGIRHTFRSSEGAHTWLVWRRYLLEVAPLLFPRA